MSNFKEDTGDFKKIDSPYDTESQRLIAMAVETQISLHKIVCAKTGFHGTCRTAIADKNDDTILENQSAMMSEITIYFAHLFCKIVTVRFSYRKFTATPNTCVSYLYFVHIRTDGIYLHFVEIMCECEVINSCADMQASLYRNQLINKYIKLAQLKKTTFESGSNYRT